MIERSRRSFFMKIRLPLENSLWMSFLTLGRSHISPVWKRTTVVIVEKQRALKPFSKRIKRLWNSWKHECVSVWTEIYNSMDDQIWLYEHCLLQEPSDFEKCIWSLLKSPPQAPLGFWWGRFLKWGTWKKKRPLMKTVSDTMAFCEQAFRFKKDINMRPSYQWPMARGKDKFQKRTIYSPINTCGTK